MAYELRISDWSSDVCSSDLSLELRGGDLANTKGIGGVVYDLCQQRRRPLADQPAVRAIQQHCTYSGVRVRQEGIGLLAREFNRSAPGVALPRDVKGKTGRSEEHTSELTPLMRIHYVALY